MISIRRNLIAPVLLGCIACATPKPPSIQPVRVPNPEEAHPLMGGPLTIGASPSGGVALRSALAHTPKPLAQPKVVQRTEGIWQIEGLVGSVPTIVEGLRGLIVFNPGRSKQDGDTLFGLISGISDKPVQTVVILDSDFLAGAQAFLANKRVVFVGHSRLSLWATGSPPGLPSALLPLYRARDFSGQGGFLPSNGPDSRLAEGPTQPPVAPLRLAISVKIPGTHRIQGFDLTLIPANRNEGDTGLSVWIPKKQLLITPLFGATFPGVERLAYGTLYDPDKWVDGLTSLARRNAEILIGRDTPAIRGRAAVNDALTDYRDAIAFVRDQTLRAILLGIARQDLPGFVQLPAAFEVSSYLYAGAEPPHWFAWAYYDAVTGSYDGDPANLWRLNRADESRRLIALMGGRRQVLSFVEDALAHHEYAWAAQLASHLLAENPSDADARKLKAAALRNIAYRVTSRLHRAYALTEARRLEERELAPRLLHPNAEDLAKLPPDALLRAFSARIDPKKAGNTKVTVLFELSDATERRHALALRRGVVTFIETSDPENERPDVVIRLSRATLAALFLSPIAFTELVSSKRIEVEGDLDAAKAFFGDFDSAQGQPSS